MAVATARWIASGEVAHPEVIEAYLQIVQELNRHDWDAWIASLAGNQTVPECGNSPTGQ